jgi:hypothetical protein
VLELSAPLLLLLPSLLELIPPLPAVVSAVVSRVVGVVPVLVPSLELSEPSVPMPPPLGLQAVSTRKAKNRVSKLRIMMSQDTKALRFPLPGAAATFSRAVPSWRTISTSMGG